MLRRLGTGVIVASALSALLTAALLDFDAILLSRQVTYAAPSGADKLLVVSYQYTIHLFLCLPIALVFCFAVHWQIGAARLRRAALLLSVAPVAIAAIALAREDVAEPISNQVVQSHAASDMNVVLIVVDTLRADRLGAYGHGEETSPFLDSLAAAGVRFARCHAPAAWTKPSVASLLTSLYPGQHGAVHFRQQLPQEVTTIAEIMFQAGFVTYGYVANPNLKTIFNFDQGFQFYDDLLMRDRLSQATLRSMPLAAPLFKGLAGRTFNFRDNDDIGVALPRITSWLERYHEQNFFMYLHFMEPHKPYAPPPPYDTMFAGQGSGLRREVTRLYDGEIRYFDDHLKELFSEFERLGILDKTLFIVTSDHGEAFGEHSDWGHDRTVYQEQLHVPLIMNFSRESWSGEVVNSVVGIMDIVPTILDYVGIDPPAAMAGMSLRSQIAKSNDSEVFVDHSSARMDYRLKAVIIDGRYKYIRTLKSRSRNLASAGGQELYDLQADPRELHNLVNERPELVAALRKRLSDYEQYSKGSIQLPPPLDLDAGTLEQLRSLGYIE